MMKIDISSDEVIHDLRSKTHTELAVSVQDETQRYRIEAGTEKLDEVRRCVQEAYGEAYGALARFLEDDDAQDDAQFSYSNSAVTLPADLPFPFRWTERRYRNKVSALVPLLFSLLVNLAMSRFYVSMQAENLAKVRSAQAQSDLSQIQALVYYKAEPIIEHVTP